MGAVGLAGCASNGCSSCAGASGAPTGPAQPVGVLGGSLDPVRAAFNAHADKPRVVLLVSPTCSECVLGARAVRECIAARFASSGIVPIVVWTAMLDSDTEGAARRLSGIFGATGAAQFYDPRNLAGWAYQREHFSRMYDDLDAVLPADHWLRAGTNRKPEPGPQWDLYMLYKPGARWGDEPPKPEAFIRHLGRDRRGRSRYFRDGFGEPPVTGDLFGAMGAMGADVLGTASGARRGGVQAMKIELLGFPGCPNTPAMRKNLAAALESIGGGLTFQDVNQEMLLESDLRRGWPTPTVLVDGHDLFGRPAPSGPAMGCRVYEGGVPSAKEITEKLSAARLR